MNRITAILLAMAALLVHILAVHRNGLGAFGLPYDSAHVAFHLGRNLVHQGGIWWSIDPATGATTGDLGSYPSPLLIWLSALVEWLAALSERGLFFSVTRIIQMIGIACAMGTVFLSTRFDTDRNAGVIPALLLVFSGAVAAAGASGTEWPLVMFLTAMAFVTLEHGRRRFASASLMALMIASPVGVVCVTVLALQTLLRWLKVRRRASRGHAAPSRRPTLWVFLPALIALGLVHRSGASLLHDLADALQFDSATLHQGLARLRDFVVVTASPILLAFPLVALVMGELSGVGRRALGLGLAAAATTVLLGGGAPESFDIAFTPALAMLFIAIQQGMARALDTYRRSMERLVWVSISFMIFVALFASRFPGDLGQIQVQRVQEKLYRAQATPAPGGSKLLGRSALFNEIRLTEQLREVGSFMRERLPEGSTVMSPWPGAIAYLSRHRVLDVFGRTTALPGHRRATWSLNPPEVDIEAALSQEPDYILPSSRSIEEIPKGELVDMLAGELLAEAGRPLEEVRNSVRASLARYEIVVTPGLVKGVENRPDPTGKVAVVKPFVLFRKRGIQEAPHLFVRDAGSFLEVQLGFDVPQAASGVSGRDSIRGRDAVKSLTQVFDADIALRLNDGSTVLLDPSGSRLEGRPGTIRSITGMLVDPMWVTPVTVARIRKDQIAASSIRAGARSLEARLYHHRMGLDDSVVGTVADPVGAPSASSAAAAPLSFLLR
ncbi:hypothetical protein Poly30_53100 [Planctomycetes bacterium Poly30]|uniref:Glycosyltransferase RgtA/B/C/D-like domain-containing protein n=1 Tax=Saltatorellus ferox TaxID=2528018 RepID=A0A518F095_9BACT|nr:hypothetical protein Poly30_53100 [Planctomycetes bacterium Poly30]